MIPGTQLIIATELPAVFRIASTYHLPIVGRVVTPMTRVVLPMGTAKMHFAVLRDLGIPVSTGPWIGGRMVSQYSANQ